MKLGKVVIITLTGIVIWAAFTQTSSSQSRQPTLTVSTPSTVSTPAPKAKSNETPRRFKITVTLIDPADLKVKEGDKVIKGQILSDRTAARQQLEAKKRQLEIAVKQMALPMSLIAELPPPNFATEEAAIAAAKAELKLLEQRPQPDFRFKDQKYQQIFDKKIIEKRALTAEVQTRAAIQLSNAIAQLEKARGDYQQRQYQHSLNLVQHQTNMQRQQYQLASLMAQQEEVDAKLRELVAVTSPYNGRVRRIKILGQTDRNITAEITINVEKASE